MAKRAVEALTSRGAIAAVNLLLAVLMAQGAWEILSHSQSIVAMQDDMEDILEGLGTIMVAFGVALEERETLLRCLGVYPEGHTPVQARVDHHCHGYGLYLLLVGLFVEVSVYLIRMPNLDTVNFDPALILAATALSVLGGVLLARLAWLVCTIPAHSPEADLRH